MKLVFNFATGNFDYVASAAADVGLTGLATNITAGKTLTLTAADNYTVTFPASGTVPLLGTANVFTTQQMVDGTSDQIQLRVQAHSTQTANLQTWENSSDTALVSISPAGRIGISSAAATPATLLDISDFTAGHTTLPALRVFRLSSYTGSSTTFATFDTIQTPNGTNSASAYTGLGMQAQSGSSATTVSTLTGFSGSVLWQTTSGTLSNAVGARLGISNTGAANINFAYGVYIATAINSGGGDNR